MDRKKKFYTTPKICRSKSGEWFVFFRFLNVSTGEYKLIKRTEDLNRVKDPTEKEKEFEALRIAREAWLKMGWNPITDPDFNSRHSKELLHVEALKDMLFCTALDYAYKKKKPDWSKKTRQDYASKIKYLKEAAIELGIATMRIFEIRRAHYRLLLEKVRVLRKLTAAGYNTYREYLSSILGELESWEILEGNPIAKIKNKTVVKKVAHRPPTPDEKRKIISKILEVSRPYYRFLSVLYGCTIRPKEICALKIKDLIHAEQVFRLIPEERIPVEENNSMGYDPDDTGEHGNTKTKVERDVVLPNWVMELLKEMHLQNFNPEWYIFAAKGPAGTFTPGPTRMHSNVPTLWWRKIVKDPPNREEPEKGGLGLSVNQYGLKKLSGNDMVKIQVRERVNNLLDLPRDQMGHATNQQTEDYVTEHKEIMKGLVREKMPVL